MFAVTMVHAAALLWLFYNPLPVAQQPVISFTVTLMDLSASQNIVSSAASTASAPAAKPEPKKVEEAAPQPRAAKMKKIVTPKVAPVAKASAQHSYNAQAQTAVISPITPAQFDAAYLQNPTPVYPALSRRLGEQGSVLLSVYVTEDGRAQSVNLKQSSGFDRLDNAAIDSVQRWRFAAAKQGERLIASWVQVPVKFVLE